MRVRTADGNRATPGRARRSIFLVIGLYLAGQITVGFALDHAPLRVRFAQADRVLRNAAALPRPPDVLFLGSSRFKAALRTDTMEETLGDCGGERPVLLDASVEAGDGFVMDLLVRRLLTAGARPRLAIIEISPETVARRNGWMNAHVARQITFGRAMAILPQIALSRRLGDLVAARLNPVYFYRKELLFWITGRKPPFLRVPDPAEEALELSDTDVEDAPATDHGEADPETAAREFRRRSARGARHIGKRLRNYEISGIAAEGVDRTIARCRAQGIEVVLLRPPVAGVQRAVYTRDIESAFRRYVQDLTRRHGARYLDDRERLPDDLFVDNHHTNAEGARAFSRLVAKEIVRPSWPGCGGYSERSPGK